MKQPQRKLTREQKIELFSMATRADPKSIEMRLSAEEQQFVDTMVDRAKYLNLAQSMNGPGFYIDRKLREFTREYNGRVFTGYGSEQPVSFQVFREFVEPDDGALVLKILPEKHYSLDPNFILDQLTDPTTERSAEDLYGLEERTIYMVSAPGGYDDLQFSGVADLAVFGWAFIRYGDEISVFVLGAKRSADRKEEKIKVEEAGLDPRKPFLKKSVGEDIDFTLDEFFDRPELYPVILLSKIDISRGTTVVRYMLTERRRSFEVITDSRELYSDMATGPGQHKTEQISGLFDRASEALAAHSSVFALMNELPHVLLGIEDRDDLKIVRTPTELHLKKSTTSVRKMKKILYASETPNFLDVATIILPNRSYSTVQIEAKQFKVEQHGYWRQLRPDQTGVGKNGDNVLGKTWVTVHESWEEDLGFSPPENNQIVQVHTGNDSDQTGEVYVMRNAQHPKDTYKVGYTTKSADERARQLESTSGQPDQFAVVESWSVTQPRRVEGIVHERLDRYRVNPRREFFNVKYSTIRTTVEEVINELEAGIEDFRGDHG
ncbi:GIY-YIG nuclease family protein [Alisedimentitalea sp. MJ-SS2]|uniref:GIY-YIG nuclease family protein n=1 Tax=Aliisedimentitalea sp. MJ-SS2 TaxID=3049795 RepID=UPI0029110172|nr:GIY-YIG nuclease family protein [Alisedimentitalea sp. MJ-SS2]MDU8928304.1 GIY-YIG nuclease family protein [Alisedimentitalea sp. MJ-SS2]